MRQVMGEAVAVPCDLLLGRKTYDIYAAYWPHVDNSPMADKLNAAVKYVATSSPGTVTWNNSRPLSGDVAAEVARLKQQDGPELLLRGSSQLAQTLLKHDLIDEFRLWVFPVVLGAGKCLFGQGARSAGLTLIDTKTSTTGVMMNTYQRSGDVQIGSFALEESTEAEVERRRTTDKQVRVGYGSFGAVMDTLERAGRAVILSLATDFPQQTSTSGRISAGASRWDRSSDARALPNIGCGTTIGTSIDARLNLTTRQYLLRPE